MSIFFSGVELVDIAVQIEKNGYAFYNSLINKAETQKSKDIFSFLAGEEKKHIATFKSIGEALGDYEIPDLYSQEEYQLYMKALADSEVFTKQIDIDKLVEKAKSDVEAIDMAMGFERDSLLFYYEIRNVVRQQDQKVVDELISQEKSHLRQLSKLKNEIQA